MKSKNIEIALGCFNVLFFLFGMIFAHIL